MLYYAVLDCLQSDKILALGFTVFCLAHGKALRGVLGTGTRADVFAECTGERGWL